MSSTDTFYALAIFIKLDFVLSRTWLFVILYFLRDVDFALVILI